MPIPHTAQSPHFSSPTLSTPTLPTPTLPIPGHPHTAHPHTLCIYFKVGLLISNVNDSICPSPHFSSPTLFIPHDTTYHIFGSNHARPSHPRHSIPRSDPDQFPPLFSRCRGVQQLLVRRRRWRRIEQPRLRRILQFEKWHVDYAVDDDDVGAELCRSLCHRPAHLTWCLISHHL